MSMTLEQAQKLNVGDQIELDKNGQRFSITGIAPQAVANKITLLLETEDGIHTFIDEKRLHLISRAGTNWKPAAVEPQDYPVDRLTAQLQETADSATQELTSGEETATVETLRENLQEALEATVESASEEIALDEGVIEERLEKHFTEEPDLKKPAKRRGRASKKGK